MPFLIRGLGVLLILAALARWRQSLQAQPGELDVIQGVALPLAWGITGYGLVRLREWGRQLMLVTAATWIVVAVVGIVVQRFISTFILVILVLSVNLALLFLSKRVMALTGNRDHRGDGEPHIEGWLAAIAGLIAFGAVWLLIFFPLTVWVWNWFWGLGTGGKIFMFLFVGTYLVSLVGMTFLAPFFVAGYFHEIAKKELQPVQLSAVVDDSAV